MMCISHKGNSKVNLLISNELIEQLKQSKQLGSWISEDGYCETDIKTRIAMWKKA